MVLHIFTEKLFENFQKTIQCFIFFYLSTWKWKHLFSFLPGEMMNYFMQATSVSKFPLFIRQDITVGGSSFHLVSTQNPPAPFLFFNSPNLGC